MIDGDEAVRLVLELFEARLCGLCCGKLLKEGAHFLVLAAHCLDRADQHSPDA